MTGKGLKALMRWSLILAILVAGIGAGCVGTVLAYSRAGQPRPAPRVAAPVGSEKVPLQVAVLSHLRLGEVGRAVELLELNLDAAVGRLGASGQRPDSGVDDPEWRMSMRAAKAYRMLYPCTGRHAAALAAILARIESDPGGPGADCPDALRRLADSRQGETRPVRGAKN